MTTGRDFTTADLASAGETSAPAEPDGSRDSDRVEPDGAAGAAGGAAETDAAAAPLFPAGDAGRFREQWASVQGQFVDEPRQAVEQADHLVAELMQRLATQFSETRAELERRWDGQENVSTEELRVAMTQYRSFFERLLQA
jgi:hypothetical protein